jgi:hypothetical protein
MAIPAVPHARSKIEHHGARQLVGHRTIVFGDGLGTGVATPVVVCTVPAGVRVDRVDTDKTVAFDDAGDLGSVGYAGDVDAFLDTAAMNIVATGKVSSHSDAQPDSGSLGRAPQSAPYDVLVDLETNAGTTAGSVDVLVWGVTEPV